MENFSSTLDLEVHFLTFPQIETIESAKRKNIYFEGDFDWIHSNSNKKVHFYKI